MHETLLLALQSDADYWLLSDGDVSITDMWRTDCILLNCVTSFSVNICVTLKKETKAI